MVILENIIKQELSKAFLVCEIKIDIDDLKKRGFATQIGQMYADALRAFHPTSITGKVGVTGGEYDSVVNKLKIKGVNNEGYDASYFSITLENGDVIEVFRNTNPAYAFIFLNGRVLAKINSANELFRKNMPDLVKQYYSDFALANKSI